MSINLRNNITINDDDKQYQPENLSNAVFASVCKLIRTNKPIVAIRVVRAKTNSSLKEAHTMVTTLRDQLNVVWHQGERYED